MSIPITVGVTGHRDLRPEDIPLLRQLVHTELKKIKEKYPDSPLAMVNSLAAGADCLCAQEAVKLGYRLICPLPAELETYRKDFSPEEETVLDELLQAACEVFVAPYVEPQTDSRNYRFRQAGIYVATHCHILLALWDGLPPKKDGCGTAEAVDFALNRSYRHESAPFSHYACTVIHVKTSRKSKPETWPVESNRLENVPGETEKILAETEEFNKDCKIIDAEGKQLIKMPGKPESVKAMETVYAKAAVLSGLYQKKYLLSLRWLSIFCVCLVMGYLFYDAGELLFMLPFYGVVLALYYGVYRAILHGKYHEKYIDYRMLAESMRVQTYLTALGVRANVGEYYTWTQRRETSWICSAISVLRTGNGAAFADEAMLKSAWVENQLSYHKSAYKKNHRKEKAADHISRCMLLCTVILFGVVIALEYFAPQFMNSGLLWISWRSWFKILWGTISAAALFVSGYYGNLSLERKAEDNQKMIPLFEAASHALGKVDCDQSEIYVSLAREEIIENGNWASYCRENRPMFSL